MQITVDIPDEFAAQVEAQGLSAKAYVERLIAQTSSDRETSHVENFCSLTEFNATLDALTKHSEKIPSLAVDAFSRESLYNDHD